MAYFIIYCDALIQYLQYNMIYRFVIFEGVEQVVTTKNPSIRNFNCFIVLLIVLLILKCSSIYKCRQNAMRNMKRSFSKLWAWFINMNIIQ